MLAESFCTDFPEQGDETGRAETGPKALRPDPKLSKTCQDQWSEAPRAMHEKVTIKRRGGGGGGFGGGRSIAIPGMVIDKAFCLLDAQETVECVCIYPSQALSPML